MRAVNKSGYASGVNRRNDLGTLTYMTSLTSLLVTEERW